MDIYCTNMWNNVNMDMCYTNVWDSIIDNVNIKQNSMKLTIVSIENAIRTDQVLVLTPTAGNELTTYFQFLKDSEIDVDDSDFPKKISAHVDSVLEFNEMYRYISTSQDYEIGLDLTKEYNNIQLISNEEYYTIIDKYFKEYKPRKEYRG